MKYKVTIITKTEEVIDADNDFDCLEKVEKIARDAKANDFDFRKLDREETKIYNSRVHPTIQSVFDPFIKH